MELGRADPQKVVLSGDHANPPLPTDMVAARGVLSGTLGLCYQSIPLLQGKSCSVHAALINVVFIDYYVDSYCASFRLGCTGGWSKIMSNIYSNLTCLVDTVLHLAFCICIYLSGVVWSL